MNRVAVGAAGVVVLLAVVAGGVLVGGFSPSDALGGPADGTTGLDATSSPNATGTPATTTESDATAIAAPTTTAGENDASYDFTIEQVSECGTTCRNVTARLANEATDPREDVRVTTGVYADGDLLWRGNETVGSMDTGEAHNTTKRVELGFAGAMAVQDNDGYVTIVTVVRSADGTERFEERRKVA